MPGSQSTPPLELYLFGGCEARVNGRRLPPLHSRRELWLLAFLALHQDRELARDRLAATFWPDNEPGQALFYLRKSLSDLRHALGAEASRLVSPTGRTVRLDLADAFCDVLAFENALARSAASATPAEPLQQAVALYRGPLLPDCPDDWAAAERQRQEHAYLTALERLARVTLEGGEPAPAARWLRLLLAADPYRESAACALMQALADSGDRAALAQVYRDLRLRLHRDLNTAPAPETEALYRRLSRQEAGPLAPPPAARSPARPRRHLPVPLSDLIGREEEIDAVVGRLGRGRLVTLVGAGGVGKTRLAIAAADALLPRFAAGVWFVDLAPVTDPALVGPATARTLGVKEEGASAGPGALVETLAAFLEPRSLLLVLDNCEHLLDACASLAFALLSACPDLRVLATSRQALGVTGEQLYRVPSLAVPVPAEDLDDPAGMEKDPAALLEYAAVRLFVERTCQANPAFRLTRQNAAAIAEICRHLDGIPLALEMAAARMRSLSAPEIQARLADRFRLLTAANRAALPRQQTLRATIEWSYDLLSEAERALLRRLSVFAGGWTLEAAEAVCGDEGSRFPEPGDVLDLLTCLVDRSLVIVEEAGAAAVIPGPPPSVPHPTRYRMLETVREYGWERLAESGETQAARRRHRDYFLRLAEAARESSDGGDEPGGMARLEQEHDNLRAALDFCAADAESIETGLRLAVVLHPFWTAGGLSEPHRRCAALLAHPGAQAPTRGRADLLLVGAHLASNQSDDEEAALLLNEALAIYRAIHDPEGIASALHVLADTCHDRATRQTYLEESLAMSQEIGDRRGIAAALNRLGVLAYDRGDYARSRQLLGESLAIYRELESKSEIAHVLHNMSCHAYLQGDFPEAKTLEEEALQLHRETGNRLWQLIILQHLGWVSLCLGDVDAARSQIQASLRLQKQVGRKLELVMALDCLGDLAHLEQQWERAACLWGAAEALRQAHDLWPTPGRPGRLEERVAEARQNLGAGAFARAWDRGQAMSMEQALDYALHHRAPGR
jgi:predicted ATPase/DNA-binding SARP family transcriptional activator